MQRISGVQICWHLLIYSRFILQVCWHRLVRSRTYNPFVRICSLPTTLLPCYRPKHHYEPGITKPLTDLQQAVLERDPAALTPLLDGAWSSVICFYFNYIASSKKRVPVLYSRWWVIFCHWPTVLTVSGRLAVLWLCWISGQRTSRTQKRTRIWGIMSVFFHIVHTAIPISNNFFWSCMSYSLSILIHHAKCWDSVRWLPAVLDMQGLYSWFKCSGNAGTWRRFTIQYSTRTCISSSRSEFEVEVYCKSGCISIAFSALTKGAVHWCETSCRLVMSTRLA